MKLGKFEEREERSLGRLKESSGFWSVLSKVGRGRFGDVGVE